jgi:hypothetical protein
MATTTQRMWIGGGNDNASNPNDWSPAGPLQPGETLIDRIPGSTINISDNVLRGDTLSIMTGLVTLNLSRHAQVDLSLSTIAASAFVNITGNATLNVTAPVPGFPGPGTSVNLADHANLFGSFDLSGRTGMSVSGAEGAKYHNNGTDTVSDAFLSLDTDVVGSGQFVTTPGFYPSGLRFGGYVSAGQSVDIGGITPFSGSVSRLQIDDPTQFHGTVDLHDASLADLVGSAQADS